MQRVKRQMFAYRSNLNRPTGNTVVFSLMCIKSPLAVFLLYAIFVDEIHKVFIVFVLQMIDTFVMEQIHRYFGAISL